MVRPTVSRCKSILGRCAVFSDRGNDSAVKMTLRVVVQVITIGLIKEHFSGDDDTRQIVDMVVLFFDIACFDIGYISTSGIEPEQ